MLLVHNPLVFYTLSSVVFLLTVHQQAPSLVGTAASPRGSRSCQPLLHSPGAVQRPALSTRWKQKVHAVSTQSSSDYFYTSFSVVFLLTAHDHGSHHRS